MINFLFAYQIAFENVEGADVEVNIYDTQSGIGTPTYTQLEASGDPLHIYVTNNDEEKFASPILALQAEISFLSTADYNMTTFMDSADNRWMTEIIVNGVVKFLGFLVIDEIQEDFLDSEFSNTVQLTATDNIGLLKDLPLRYFETIETPQGDHRIVRYIAMALLGTGLELPINICHNLREENNPTTTIYNSLYLDARSAEDEVKTAIDSYRVLAAILREDSYLTQHNGEWWVIRVDEIPYGDRVIWRFTSDGLFDSVSTVSMDDYQKTFDPNGDMYFSNMSTFVQAQQTFREVALYYPFEYWKEIVDNIDFDRGDEVSLGIPDSVTQTIDDWTLYQFPGGPSATPTGTTAQAYFRIHNNAGTEERYAVIGTAPSNQFLMLLTNRKFPIDNQDKFYFNIDAKYEIAPSSSPLITRVAQVILNGYDGSKWYLTNGTPALPEIEWRLNNPNIFIWYNQQNVDYNGDWLSTGFESPPCPVAGEIEVRLVHDALTTVTKRYFQNLRIDYIPYIQGSYQKYKGKQNIINQDVPNKKVYDEEVRLSDSPKMLFKWALRRYNGTRYVLAGRVYDGLQFGSTVPSDDFLHPFSYNQAFAVWNQNNRAFRIFDFEAQGLDTLGDMPSLVHRFTINETSSHTTNKKFMLLHYDMDLYLCEWKGKMTEVSDDTIENDYDSPHELKYLTER